MALPWVATGRGRQNTGEIEVQHHQAAMAGQQTGGRPRRTV